jgi:hypothetical protein
MTRCRRLPPPLPKETLAERSLAHAEGRKMAREKKARSSSWPGKRFSLERCRWSAYSCAKTAAGACTGCRAALPRASRTRARRERRP